MTDDGPIFVISGQLAAGKSSVARAILQRFPRGVCVDVDEIRGLVVSGLASPLEWSDETTRQFDLALEASAAITAVYHRAGFAVAVEGGFEPATLDRHLEAAGLRHDVAVELHPPLEAALRRNRERTTKSFDAGILEPAIRQIDADLAANPSPPGWTRIDNGDEDLATTVERVLALAAR